MSFRNNFSYMFKAPRILDDGGIGKQFFDLSVVEKGERLRLITGDRQQDVTLVILTKEQAEELAVALTYALTSDET
jgi:hypothetical protein